VGPAVPPGGWSGPGTDRDGKRVIADNSVLLANRKAKALASLLKAESAFQKGVTDE
jgi:hypothetical protein